MKPANASTLTVVFYFLISTVVAQKQPVQWTICADSTSKHERNIKFEAKIAPGWHLYSQYIGEGGPIPTTFNFQQLGYKTVGVPDEAGKRVVFYDDIYGMNLSWYSDQVMFVQKIKLTGAPMKFNGVIEYMACNGEVCVPSKKEFSLPVNLDRK
jgi:DsbC/DsbD-like thiol-disulfide interchange protein